MSPMTGAILKEIQERIDDLNGRMGPAKRQGACQTLIGYEQGIFELERLKKIIQRPEEEAV